MDPKRVPMEGHSGAIISAISACGSWEHLQHSFLLMEAVLWCKWSSRKRSHSLNWAVLQLRCSLQFIEITLTLEVQSATLFEQLVLWANSFGHFPSMGKFPYWRVTNSSILEYMMSALLFKTNRVTYICAPFKQVLDKQPLSHSFYG